MPLETLTGIQATLPPGSNWGDQSILTSTGAASGLDIYGVQNGPEVEQAHSFKTPEMKKRRNGQGWHKPDRRPHFV
jgi:hypothetical protein